MVSLPLPSLSECSVVIFCRVYFQRANFTRKEYTDEHFCFCTLFFFFFANTSRILRGNFATGLHLAASMRTALERLSLFLSLFSVPSVEAIPVDDDGDEIIREAIISTIVLQTTSGSSHLPAAYAVGHPPHGHKDPNDRYFWRLDIRYSTSSAGCGMTRRRNYLARLSRFFDARDTVCVLSMHLCSLW